MRLPVKSENDAFRIAWGTAIVAAGALVLGALTSPIAGVALFAGVVLGALGWNLYVRDPDRRAPLREAAAAGMGGEHDERPRLLVIANETLVGRELRDELLARRSERPSLRVVAPVLPSRSHYVTSDIDRELREAGARLDATLAWALEHGFEATGTVCDQGPLVAIEDELRRFAADELLVSTHPPGRSNWLEQNVVSRARAELDIPVRHVVVDLAKAHAEVVR